MNWINDGFTLGSWNALKRTIREKRFCTEYSDVFGQFKCGALCFDMILRDPEYYEDGKWHIDADAYLLGKDDGYGYTAKGTPYTEADGTQVAINTRMGYATVFNRIIQQLDDAVEHNPVWKEYAEKTDTVWKKGE